MEGTNYTLRGPSGELRYGYQQAAQLRDWTIQLNPAGLLLRAAVATQHDIWIAQPTLRCAPASGARAAA